MLRLWLFGVRPAAALEARIGDRWADPSREATRRVLGVRLLPGFCRSGVAELTRARRWRVIESMADDRLKAGEAAPPVRRALDVAAAVAPPPAALPRSGVRSKAPTSLGCRTGLTLATASS